MLGERTVIVPEHEEDEFIVYPVVVLTSATGVFHATYTDRQERTVCGRKVDKELTMEAYRTNSMFSRLLCNGCHTIVKNNKEAGYLG